MPVTNPNTFHGFDVVIRPELSGAYSVWRHDKQISIGTAGAARMIAVAAHLRDLSVYDEESDCALSDDLNLPIARANLSGHIRAVREG